MSHGVVIIQLSDWLTEKDTHDDSFSYSEILSMLDMYLFDMFESKSLRLSLGSFLSSLFCTFSQISMTLAWLTWIVDTFFMSA